MPEDFLQMPYTRRTQVQRTPQVKEERGAEVRPLHHGVRPVPLHGHP